MTTARDETLARAREAYGRSAWGEAYALYRPADAEASLPPDDLERFAAAAHLTQTATESFDLWTRAHYEYLRQGSIAPAVRCAFWLCFAMTIRGDHAQANGWLARAERLLDESGLECVEAGYLKVPTAARMLWSGNLEPALAGFIAANDIARRYGDRDLMAITCMSRGEVLIEMKRTAEGLPLLDEAMAMVMAGEVSALMAGVVYCATLSSCQRQFDLRRSQEWTAAFTRWCDSMPGLVPYRGDCMVYRAEVMQLQGSWPSAMEEARRACEAPDDAGRMPWAGQALYRQGELHRLRGDYASAEAAYRQANQAGETPQPGLALLRLAQGRGEAATSGLTRVLAETPAGMGRAKLLAACVEVLLAQGNVEAAQHASAELDDIVADRQFPLLDALSDQAGGAVLLARGDCTGALGRLRRAWSAWHEMDVPYEAARIRVSMALACRGLGDEHGAQLDLDAALRAFEDLGAGPDAERVRGLISNAAPRPDGGLTARELEVLRLVAAGNTNRQIAEALVLSEKTVARHVSNIFARLGISSRSAATAYAYEHKLMEKVTGN